MSEEADALVQRQAAFQDGYGDGAFGPPVEGHVMWASNPESAFSKDENGIVTDNIHDYVEGWKAGCRDRERRCLFGSL